MIRFTLFSAVLCATAFGLSEQNKFMSCFGFSGNGCHLEAQNLSPDEKDIKEIGDQLEKAHLGDDLDGKLKVIAAIADQNSENGLANSLKDLDPKKCDQMEIKHVNHVRNIITRNRRLVENQADYTDITLSQYLDRAYKVCRDEEIEAEQHEFDAFGNLLASLDPNSSLESKLEIIASKGSSNKFAALFVGLKTGKCDPNLLEESSRARRAITNARYLSAGWEESNRILSSYMRQLLDACFVEAAETLKANTDASRKALEEISPSVTLAIRIFLTYEGRLRDDLRELAASIPLESGHILLSQMQSVRDKITGVPGKLNQQMRTPNWLGSVEDAEEKLKEKILRPCEALINFEKTVRVLQPILTIGKKLLFTSSIDTLKAAIGELGSDRSELVRLASRFGVCNWFASVNLEELARYVYLCTGQPKMARFCESPSSYMYKAKYRVSIM